ncbi:5'-3' exonuclease [Anoxybacillus rupiensis]|jgi:5'-3' exonuclease|uniref:5'-3' exonuclease n=1 Tax=Anoxybacteroides rupiense TaxID=311460 RepID=A0ABD5IXI8_9BACL|nr:MULTISPECIES: 5'-3' exonuclease [Anoxybacillus]KXG09745.1 5'-3' exonuclease [Anoxybacillus sp. P3H1B]MBB3908490.1 5'-3' exonuclease [Anoxybacillus rupiensis]MBS2770891.1 5'-3' exonuclease [Anoxybacillus rupiensis]MDE8563597.1 5'-3' exonuclease [Anoxybacillus rupiensis]MED5052928.1 5'-3' exonuclease [Anoxybacillus rupiensis]
MTNTHSHLLLVDGMALLFRSFYATAPSGQWMRNSRGVPTNAVHGLIRHLSAALQTIRPTHVVCCWDMGSTTFRTEWFPDYKANRGDPPPELVPQFDLAKEAVAALEIPNIGVLGAEADDCIGTIVKQYGSLLNISILTGDRDLFQLLSPNVSVYLLAKGIGHYEVYTDDRFYEEKGLLPQQLVDVKALMGDSSDNYPGVRGIGEKTAFKLIQQYGSIEGLVENLEQLTKAQQKKISENLEMLYLSRKLATIYCEIPLSLRLEEAKWTGDFVGLEKVKQMLA